MTKEEIHQQNIGLYLSIFGDVKTAKALEYPSMENRARLSFLLKGRSEKLEIRSEKLEAPAPIQEPEKPKVLGLISQYPKELHKAYKSAMDLWIEVCSLKIRLNDVPKQNEKTAFIIQTKMLDKMDEFDRYKEALTYYNEHKRILPTESQTDYTNLTAMQTIKKRNNTRVSITKRKKTIADHEKALPPKTDPFYYKRLSALNRKKEQLQELILEEQKLSKLVKES